MCACVRIQLILYVCCQWVCQCMFYRSTNMRQNYIEDKEYNYHHCYCYHYQQYRYHHSKYSYRLLSIVIVSFPIVNAITLSTVTVCCDFPHIFPACVNFFSLKLYIFFNNNVAAQPYSLGFKTAKSTDFASQAFSMILEWGRERKRERE